MTLISEWLDLLLTCPSVPHISPLVFLTAFLPLPNWNLNEPRDSTTSGTFLTKDQGLLSKNRPWKEVIWKFNITYLPNIHAHVCWVTCIMRKGLSYIQTRSIRMKAAFIVILFSSIFHCWKTLLLTLSTCRQLFLKSNFFSLILFQWQTLFDECCMTIKCWTINAMPSHLLLADLLSLPWETAGRAIKSAQITCTVAPFDVFSYVIW